MNWKVGTKLKFIKNGFRDSTEIFFTKGKIYTIVNLYSDFLSGYSNGNGTCYQVVNNGGSTWTIEVSSFRSHEPITEVDYLDAFKENFIDGG